LKDYQPKSFGKKCEKREEKVEMLKKKEKGKIKVKLKG
jgi:hypothetical protein